MNEQIKNELFSAYQYLSMAAYCESENSRLRAVDARPGSRRRRTR